MSKILKVRKLGDSLIMTIPKHFAEVIGIKLGTKLEMEFEKNKTISLKVLE